MCVKDNVTRYCLFLIGIKKLRCVTPTSLSSFSFLFLLSERLAEGEFIKGVIENENAMRLIHYEPIKE